MNPDIIPLIEKFKKGDSTAFAGLVHVYQDRIYNLCCQMLGHTQNAEDAAQDSFIKAFRHLKDFTPEASFYTWLYRITINTCLDYSKKPFFESLFKKSAGGEEFMLVEISHDLSPESLYEAKQLGEVLQACLNRLSPKLKAVLILKEMEGLSYQEIAEIMACSLGTVKSRISRARVELQELMKNDGIAKGSGSGHLPM
jgi:RNA polymerase sigma-70 factor (ECF subfamily)